MSEGEIWREKVYHLRSETDCNGIRWFRLRLRVLKRDRFQCRMCKRFFAENGLILTAHHIKPRDFGGKNILSNLISLCPKCHDIAEIYHLSKKDIIEYKQNKENSLYEKPKANDKD